MKLQSGVEDIPLTNSSFDVISSINSLDHVTDYKQGISEIERILTPSGLFLLIVDIHPTPTECEPHSFSWNLSREFNERGLITVREWHYESGGKYCNKAGTQSVKFCPMFNHRDRTVRHGFLKAIFKKPLVPTR